MYLYANQDEMKYCSLRCVVSSNHDIIERAHVLVHASNEWLGVKDMKLQKIA
jgi:hypothetical protein